LKKREKEPEQRGDTLLKVRGEGPLGQKVSQRTGKLHLQKPRTNENISTSLEAVPGGNCIAKGCRRKDQNEKPLQTQRACSCLLTPMIMALGIALERSKWQGWGVIDSGTGDRADYDEKARW